jgi:hypothetical protein
MSDCRKIMFPRLLPPEYMSGTEIRPPYNRNHRPAISIHP